VDQTRALVFAYVASLLTMLALDAAWLSLMYKQLYKPGLRTIMRDAPSLPPAILFYLLYAFGITVLVVANAASSASLSRALLFGALLGLVAYGTYDLTNHATVRGWPLTLTVADMAWGACMTAIASMAGYFAARTFG
jgi:uncharacterized membrane protein